MSSTTLIFVELVELYTLHGERPPRNFQARASHSCAATCEIAWEDVAIIDTCKVVQVRLLFFHCMPAGRYFDSTPDSREACSSVLMITVRFVRC